MDVSKNNDMVVRDAHKSDADTIIRFNIAMAWETERKELMPEIITPGVHAVFDHPEYGFYLVGTVDECIAGSCMITYEWSDWRNGLFWWMQSVYVEPLYRKQGVFRALYDTVKERASHNPTICGIRLYVEKENYTAQKTYTALGMHETHYRLFEE